MIDFSKIEFHEVKDDSGRLIGMWAALLFKAEVQMPGDGQLTRSGKSIDRDALKLEVRKNCLHSIFSNLYGDIRDLINNEFKKMLNATRQDYSTVEIILESREKMIDAVSLDKAMESCQQNSNVALNT